ncbi:hypothetical protein BS650_02460 [Aeromonas hydrophila]|nr:hypothetical protein [Aeromonas hydrophila]ALQ63391.1 hypothetical protein AS145_11060 [Aeromonas hydrophila]ALZ80059.1 hypothetical protein AhyD4_10850 [Aeromonas hydrophila]ANS00043.1 hypothetical protein A9258_10610 [Aeromonas hydrophila]AXV29962.1 hypothetical protein BFW97_10870 [Aeromonas hydrophila]EGX6957499.1 hypothetical protein [Aeromonas hydrophila]
MNGGSFTTDSASAAGKKSVEARRRNKVIKDQYYLALAGKADELVTAFTAGGTVLGVNLPNDARARIIEQVVAQVMGGSMINAVRHNSEVDLLLLKDELKRDETRYEDPTQGDDMTVAYMTVAELMAKEGSASDAKSAAKADAISEVDRKPAGEQSFLEWYNSQSSTRQKHILADNFDGDMDELFDQSAAPARSIIRRYQIQGGV